MNIYESITKIMNDVPIIKKKKQNSSQGFMYRGIEDVMNTIHPLLAKYKVFVVPQMLEQTREERTTTKGGTLLYSICKIKFIFYAEDGSFIEAITTGEGMDSGDKATNKAMAIALKYAFFQVFCIPTGMIDPDLDSHSVGEKKIDKKIETALRESISKNNIPDDDVIKQLKEMEHEKLSDLTISEIMTFRKGLGLN